MAGPMPNIWLLQSRGDVEGLIGALRYADSSIRRGAAAALRALGAWQAVPALQSALNVESDWQVHAAISAALQYLDHDIHIETLVRNRDVRGLIKMLNSARLDDVLTACNALAVIGDKLASEHLVMVFRNTALPNRIRLAAAEALLKLESAPGVITLLGALRRDDWQVRRNAAAVLGNLQASWATEPLIKALNDPIPAVAQMAAAALRRIGAQEALVAVQNYEKALARRQATQTQPLTGPATAPLSPTLSGSPADERAARKTGTLTAPPTPPASHAPTEPIATPARTTSTGSLLRALTGRLPNMAGEVTSHPKTGPLSEETLKAAKRPTTKPLTDPGIAPAGPKPEPRPETRPETDNPKPTQSA